MAIPKKKYILECKGGILKILKDQTDLSTEKRGELLTMIWDETIVPLLNKINDDEKNNKQ